MGKGPRGRRAHSRAVGGRIGLALALLALCMLWAAPARAADPYPGGQQTPPQVLGNRFFNDDPPPAELAATDSSGDVRATAAGSGGLGLAFTGAGILILLVTAVLAMILGFVLWRSAHRRSAPSDL